MRLLDRLAAVTVLLAFFHHYQAQTLALNLQTVGATAAGAAWAPAHWRILVPLVWEGLMRWGLSAQAAMRLIEASTLVGGSLVLFALGRRLGWGVPDTSAAAFVAFWGLTTLRLPRPEVFPSFLLTMLGAYGLLAGRLRWGLLVWAVIGLSLTRAEHAVALGLTVAVFGLRRRRVAQVLGGLGLAGLAVALLGAVAAARPAASYQIAPVQLGYNLTNPAGLWPLLFFVPWLVALYGRWRTGTLWDEVGLLSAWIVFVLGSTLLLGRIDEARMLFPLSGLVALQLFTLWPPGAHPQSARRGPQSKKR